MRSIFKTSAAALAAATTLSGAAYADGHGVSGPLRIFSDMSNPAPRAVMEGMVERFTEANPGVEVELVITDREAWKTQIRNVLQSGTADIVNWYAGNRMAPYVEAGLFMDISDLWEEGGLTETLASTQGSMTMDDGIWGVPYTYYQWGVYYREDIFAELGLEAPTTWEEELSNCQAIVDSGRSCYTIGTQFLWTAGGWFDYLNMRTNGYDFHMELTAGEVPWTDDRVRATFENWQTLIDMGAFIDDHQSYSWQEALPFMVNGEATAYLMGNFAVAPLREAGLSDDQLGFYQFPQIDASIEPGEDAPTDTFHIAANAENVEAAEAFLLFVASAENQTLINNGDNLGQLPVNSEAGVDDDEFLNAGFDMLSNNAGGGIAQFFDRDAPAEMAQVAMQGFQQFMVDPSTLDQVLQILEGARQRIY